MGLARPRRRALGPPNRDHGRRGGAAASEVVRFGGVLLLQQLLSGRREALSFLYANGRVHARFAQWARRTGPPVGGESVLRQSIAIPSDTGAQANA